MKRLLYIALAFLLVACKNAGYNPPMGNDNTNDPTIDSALVACEEHQIAYLSDYETPADLVSDGDDDEICSWLWFHEQYPEAQYLYLGDIRSSEDLDSLSVLFWLRDVESDTIIDVLTFSDAAQTAAPIISDWYREGGNIILWSHAVLYVEQLGRLPQGTYTAESHDFGCGFGHGRLDLGHWMMSVQLYPGGKFKKDHSTHPLFRNLPIYDNNDLRGFNVKGPGWTEDHNCLFFNYPKELTGRSEQQEICYTLLTEYFGIWPLAVWDSQIHWVSQLNVYELRQGQTDFRGRILCIGNGGCEFSMRNEDGSADITPCPTNNIYQANILKMAHNAIEYMRL